MTHGEMKKARELRPRYFAGMLGEQRGPLTAREVREWRVRVEIGGWSVKYSEADEEWQLFFRTIVGTRDPVETWAYAESFSFYRDAFAAMKKKALRAAGRL